MSRRALSDNRDRPGSGSVSGGTSEYGAASRRFMRHAIALAADEQPHPNPRVGCVMVDDTGEVVAAAAHRRAGEPHAEALALAAAGERAPGATVYVTLEPCSHHGRTPPCSRALVAAGVARVVVGAVDPDQRVSGRGIAELRAAGIDVVAGLLADEVEAIDPGYFHHRRTGRPLVTLKLATTLDGQIAAADRTSRWITGEQARRDGHVLRAESDVVIVGAGTVIADDPSLNVRLDGYTGRHPRPVIVAGARAVPAAARLRSRDAIVYEPRGGGRSVDLDWMLADLGSRGYVTALVEGGARLAEAMVRSGHVDRLVIYLAGKLGLGVGVPAFSGVFATIGEAVDLRIDSVSRVGDDIKVEAKVGT